MLYNSKEPKSVPYKQCKLKRENTTTTSWIPVKFAKVGKCVKLKDEDGWIVEEVGSLARPYDDVSERSQDYKKTRRASDI